MKTIFVTLFLSSLLWGQVEARKQNTAFDIPEFFVDALGFASGDSTTSRVDVYVQIPYDALQFVKTGTTYTAKYEITLNFLANENISVSEKIWTEEIRVQQSEMTESKKIFSFTHRSVFIAPGIYSLRTQLRDNESKKVSLVVKRLIVDNYVPKPLSVSDVMLLNKLSVDGDKKNISPNVSGNIGEKNGTFSIFFEVYSKRMSDSLELSYRVADIKGKQLLNKIQYHRTTGTKNQIVMTIDSVGYSAGAYLLNLEVRSLLEKEQWLPVMKQKAFVVRWGNMPISISDIALAVKQLRYIAKNDEYETIADEENETEQRRLFEEFWKRRDPNPDTKRNEYMEEYYSRVEYANQHFSHYQAGWKTDMGMVFILFGSPNNVERHPFDIDSKPYEVWSYYDYDRNIVFVDETGFGDYRLLTPIYDLLQRLKQ